LLGACATIGNLPRLTKFVRNDGRTAFLEVHARCIFEPDLFTSGRVCALIDVSDRVQAEMKIRNLQAQLEARVASRTAELRRSNAELQEFAYVASHDLQAPLKQLRSVFEQLALKSNDPETAELLCRSQQDTNRMLMLIDGLLNYAVASNPAAIPSPQVPLVVALEESLMILASSIASSGATVAYEDLPSFLVDESAFVQLFQNLVGNAIKYRGPEAPRVRISATHDNDFWSIAVKDKRNRHRPRLFRTNLQGVPPAAWEGVRWQRDRPCNLQKDR
jgi:light-regulated signal transduction histidine kinase (bacteriophytochrome)